MSFRRPMLAWCLALAAAAAHAAAPRIADCVVFPDNNAWNTPVDMLPLHPLSATWVGTIGATRNLHPDFGTFFQGAPIGIPFVVVPQGQARVPIAFEVPEESDPGPYPIPPDAPIEGGAGSSGDRHVLVLERGTCTLWELFDAFPQAGGGWRAFSGARFDLSSNALRPDTWTSADAAGLPILPGLIRYDEVVAGEITHAIRFTAPQTRAQHIWPARHDASSLTGTEFPPMGARFRLKASFDIAPYSPQAQVILRAMKRYGIILADNGSPWFLTGEHHPSWNDAVLGELKQLHGSDFEAVDTQQLMLQADSGKALQPPPPVTLREVASGLSAPVEIVNARDGSNRLFIAEVSGTIRILRDGAVLPRPFLQITDRLTFGGESGLLGLAFDPGHAANRRFYVYYTMLDGSLRISRFLASAADPDVADAGSEQEIITIPHPDFANHNGGRLVFGPDGYLYIGTGDGGSGSDPPNNAQNLAVLLGKILRLDVSTAAGYAIPPSNPTWAGVPGARREVFAYGLRNPWRFSFDRATQDIFIADVGQSTLEELNYVPAGTLGGRNFGWRVFEGNICHVPATGCFLADHTPPVIVYGRDLATGGRSITGGYMYRGARSSTLNGTYIYGDYVSNRMWGARQEDGKWGVFVLSEPPGVLNGLASFGEDERGEMYVASINSGRVYAIEGPVTGAGLHTPAPGSTLDGDTVTFRWNAVSDATLYQLWVGTTPGGFELGYFPAAGTTASEVTVADLPLDGRTLYVRLYTAIAGQYHFRDYTFTASNGAARLLAPAASSTLAGSSQAFTWNDSGAVLYQLWVGDSPGAFDVGYYPAQGTTATSVTATGLPTDGRVLYVRLYSNNGSAYVFNDYQFRAATAGAIVPATISSPAPGSMLSGASQTFEWATTGASLYQLWVGNSQGAFDIGYFPAGGTTGGSTTATGLPTDGRLLHVRLYSLIDGAYQFRDFTYAAASSVAPATITSPAAGSTLTSTTQTFTWNDAGASLYQLWIGSSVGAFDYGYFPESGTTGTSLTVSGLPTGRVIHVRLYSAIGGIYYFTDRTYTMAP